MKKIDLPVPDHSTLSKRGKTLKVKLARKAGGSMNLVLDSTGLKIYGEGEWKVRKHGYSKRHTWRKLHLGADPDTGEIQAEVLTENSISDDAVVQDMLEQIEQTLLSCAADGAYDKRKVYDALNAHSPDVDMTKTMEARISGYHVRSLAETIMFRLKIIFGDKLSTRLLETQSSQALIRCLALNKMTHLGLPESYLVA